MLALPYVSPAYDVWSLGCLAYALATGQDLFAPQVVLQERQEQQQEQLQHHEAEQAPLTLEERHLVDMLALLGRPPPAMVAASGWAPPMPPRPAVRNHLPLSLPS